MYIPTGGRTRYLNKITVCYFDCFSTGKLLYKVHQKPGNSTHSKRPKNFPSKRSPEYNNRCAKPEEENRT